MDRHEADLSGAAKAPPAAALASAEVFISYAREDRTTAEQLAQALAAQSIGVWWDRQLLAGSEFAEAIEAQLERARVVLVLWSAESTRSAFVRDESSRALRAGKLLPLRIEAVDPPLGFGQIHTLDLIGWDGDSRDEAFQQLLRELRRMQGSALAPDLAPRRVGRRALRRLWLAGGAFVLVAALGYGGKLVWDREQRSAENERAEEMFLRGLDSQSAKEPLLDSAFNAFLSAVQLNPRHARAHYYLGHLYVQRRQPTDALEAFRVALAAADSPLDRTQRAEAQKQESALSLVVTAQANEEPVSRPAAAPRASPSPAERPLPGPRAAPPVAEGPPPTAARPPVLRRGEAPAVAVAPTAVEAAPRRPVPVEAPAASLARLGELVDSMFAADKDKRISATTSLVVDAPAVSDAVPLAVVKAQAVLRESGGVPAPAQASGIVNTLVLLQSALPSTLQLHRAAIEQLLASARQVGETTRQHADKVSASMQQAADRRPLAFIQIANEAQRPIAEALRQRLRAFGYDAPAAEVVGSRAPQRSEVRVHGRSDQGLARWIAKATGEIAGAAPTLATLRSVDPRTDTFEIWIERGLCAPGGRQSSICGE